MKRIVVTGGAGFIGQNLICRLCAEDDCQVVCVDQRACRHRCKSCECVIGSFADQALMRTLLSGTDMVVHLGSNALPTNADYVADVEQNLLGSISLIKECEKAGVRRFIFASSGGTVYGPNALVPTPETSAVGPICSYGIIKVAIEHYLSLATRLSGLQAVTLRIANPYGPWQNWNAQQGVVSVFCHRILNDEPITLFGDGSISRDFVFINDLVDAFLKAMKLPVNGDPINIGSGHGVSMRDLISTIGTVISKTPTVKMLPARDCDVPCSCLDITRAGDVLGWRPKTMLVDGIRKTIEWQMQNPDAF